MVVVVVSPAPKHFRRSQCHDINMSFSKENEREGKKGGGGGVGNAARGAGDEGS